MLLKKENKAEKARVLAAGYDINQSIARDNDESIATAIEFTRRWVEYGDKYIFYKGTEDAKSVEIIDEGFDILSILLLHIDNLGDENIQTRH